MLLHAHIHEYQDVYWGKTNDEMIDLYYTQTGMKVTAMQMSAVIDILDSMPEIAERNKESAAEAVSKEEEAMEKLIEKRIEEHLSKKKSSKRPPVKKHLGWGK